MGAFAILSVLFFSSVCFSGMPTEGFPESVFIKSKTETFDLFSQYLVRGGKIWTKPLNSNEEWSLMDGVGLPYPNPIINRLHFVIPKNISYVTADADELVAVSDDGRVYTKRKRSKTWGSKNEWMDRWGVPRAPLNLNDPVNQVSRNFRSLSLGRRNQWVKYFEDSAGNPHHFGITGTTTLYVLDQSGQEISFVDNGLPQDLSHKICGPDRGTFIAESLSTSGSTLFVINRFGESYTKMEDYDLNGGSSPVLNYSFDSTFRPQDSGQDIKTNWHTWALPLEGWRKQPAIQLTGLARISKDITILQNGEGNAARELRVGGLSPEGEIGYYRKQIFDPNWEFVRADLTIQEDHFLEDDLVSNSYQYVERASSRDIAYQGGVDLAPVHSEQHWSAELLDFNLTCSPARLRIHLSSYRHVDFLLHTTEMWAVFYKRRAPGVDGTPKLFFGTLEIPDEVLQSIDPEIQWLVSTFRPLHRRAFQFVVQATRDWVWIESARSKAPSKKAQATTPIQMNFKRVSVDPYAPMEKMDSDLRVFSFFSVEDYLARANSDSLLAHPARVQSSSNLRDKIRLNETAKDFLRKNFAIEKQILKQNQILKRLLKSTAKGLRKVKGERVKWSPINAFTQRGMIYLQSYQQVGEALLKEAQSGYRQAMQVLEERIAAYKKQMIQ